jgi:hypothetical protein
MAGFQSYLDMLRAHRPIGPITAQYRADSLDLARRARRLAQGLPDADRDRLLAYAQELECEAVAVEVKSGKTEAWHQIVTWRRYNAARNGAAFASDGSD